MNEDCFHLGIKAIIRNKKGKILLLKVNTKLLIKKAGYNGEIYWDIPGGRIKKGSSINETLKAEILEETGIKNIISIEPFNFCLSNIRIPLQGDDHVGLILFAYTCKVADSENITLSDEDDEFGWFEPKEAAKLLKFKYPGDFTYKISLL